MVVISCYLEVDKDRALKYQTNESSYFNSIHDGGVGWGWGKKASLPVFPL